MDESQHRVDQVKSTDDDGQGAYGHTNLEKIEEETFSPSFTWKFSNTLTALSETTCTKSWSDM
jgi:hypothetical protein